MGGWLSYIWWGGDPDVVNPYSGLSRRDIYAVQKSWAPVHANSTATGTELLRRNAVLYIKKTNSKSLSKELSKRFIDYTDDSDLLLEMQLFQTYPETKDYFKMVRKLPEEEYISNPQFKAHVMNLMTSLNLAVNNLHQPEVVAAMMNKLGESHKRRQIKEKNFHELKEVIVKLFIDVLKLDNATLGSWSKTVDFWYKHIFETLNSPAETR